MPSAPTVRGFQGRSSSRPMARAACTAKTGGRADVRAGEGCWAPSRAACRRAQPCAAPSSVRPPAALALPRCPRLPGSRRAPAPAGACSAPAASLPAVPGRRGKRGRAEDARGRRARQAWSVGLDSTAPCVRGLCVPVGQLYAATLIFHSLLQGAAPPLPGPPPDSRPRSLPHGVPPALRVQTSQAGWGGHK